MNPAAAWIARAGFDAASYLDDNPRLAGRGITVARAEQHFLRHGYAEDRKLRLHPLPAGLADFDPMFTSDRTYRSRLCQAVYRAQVRAAGSKPYLWSGNTAELDAFFTRSNARPFTVIGDSHSDVYRRYGAPAEDWLAPVPLMCMAASATGLARTRSRSGHGPRILRWAEQAARGAGSRAPVFLKFGQVDVEFVFTFQRIRAGQTAFSYAAFNVFARDVVERYLVFINSICDRIDRSRLRVCTIFPPALADASWKARYLSASVHLEGDRSMDDLAEGVRTLEIPDLSIRTAMHRLFNGYLREACLGAGLRFLDDFHPFLGPDDRLDLAYVPKTCGSDHHLEYVPTAGPITALIEQNLDEIA